MVECGAGPEVLVRLLDVGYQERVPMERLRHLPPQVSRLPPTSLLLAFRGPYSNQRSVSNVHGSGRPVMELEVC